MKYQDSLVNKMVEHGHKSVFEGYESFVVNSPVLISEINYKIYEGAGKIAIIWSHRKKVTTKNNSIAKIGWTDKCRRIGGKIRRRRTQSGVTDLRLKAISISRGKQNDNPNHRNIVRRDECRHS